MFKSLLKKLTSKPSKLSLTLTALILSPYILSQSSPLSPSSSNQPSQSPYNFPLYNPFLQPRINCLTTHRVNKPQFVQLLNSSKEEVLILVYNRENQNSLKEEILAIQDMAEKLGVAKVVLVDQTDIRHLETFQTMLKKTPPNQPLPISLPTIQLLYLHPSLPSTHPLPLPSSSSIPTHIPQIRSLLHTNPSPTQLQQSINTSNRTTVVAMCQNTVCVEEFRDRVRGLVEGDMVWGRGEGVRFFVATGKNQVNRIANVVGSNKQDVYVFWNDMLGKGKATMSQFAQVDTNMNPESKFMMLIRPRIHILSRKSFTADLLWYINTIKFNPVPTFSITNTSQNLPIKPQSSPQPQPTEMISGHPCQINLVQTLKQKYGSKLELLIIDTTAPSELLRHVYQPERYAVYLLTPQVPYPKMFIRPSPIQLGKGDGKGEGCEQDWGRVLEKVDTFIKKPAHYNYITLYSQKQQQINPNNLQHLLTTPNPNRWIFRICGPHNPCLYSIYQKYGIGIDVPVYKIDSVLNTGIDEGDYQVVDGVVGRM